MGVQPIAMTVPLPMILGVGPDLRLKGTLHVSELSSKDAEHGLDDTIGSNA
jgi:hypothetical protein